MSATSAITKLPGFFHTETVCESPLSMSCARDGRGPKIREAGQLESIEQNVLTKNSCTGTLEITKSKAQSPEKLQ